MPEHDIADCPKCGKRDLVLQEDGEWRCLNPDCEIHEKGLKMPKSGSESESKSDFLNILLTVLATVLFVMLFLGGV